MVLTKPIFADMGFITSLFVRQGWYTHRVISLLFVQVISVFPVEKIKGFVGYKYPCHSISPSESVFSAKAYFTAYKSPVGDYLAEICRRLQSVGFRVVMESWIKNTNELEVEGIRRDVEKNDKD